MKSQLNEHMLQVVTSILSDCKLAYPEECEEFDRDIKRIALLYQSRGIGLFIDLFPQLDKALLIGLSTSRLPDNFPLSKRRSLSARLPRFLWGLWSRVFDTRTAVLLDSVDINAVLFIRQIACVFKAIELPCNIPTLKEYSNVYGKVDSSLPSPSLDWDSPRRFSDSTVASLSFGDDNLVTSDRDLFMGHDSAVSRSHNNDYSSLLESVLLSNFQKECDEVLNEFRDNFLFNPISWNCYSRNVLNLPSGFKHGPGATATSGRYTDKYTFPNWPVRLRSGFPAIFGRIADPELDSNSYNHENASRLIAVPKVRSKPRLIAAEPVENQYCQQMMLSYLSFSIENSVLSKNISLKNQIPSQLMAQRGSLDGSLATIDLSSASDRLSCHTVERAFRSYPELLHYLHACRTSYVKNTIVPGEVSFLRLKKFASQGAAVTFPVQSIIFCLAARSIGRLAMFDYDDFTRNVRTFGDDIIIPNAGYVFLVKLLERLHLQVNLEKSFHTGNFRESCGGDFFKGHDVTPIKIRRLGTTDPDLRCSLVDSSNNFFRNGFWITGDMLRKFLPGNYLKLLPVIELGSGPHGFECFSGHNYHHLRRRWNYGTSTLQYKRIIPKGIMRFKDRSGTSRLRMFLLEPPVNAINYCTDLPTGPGSSDRAGWETLPHKWQGIFS